MHFAHPQVLLLLLLLIPLGRRYLRRGRLLLPGLRLALAALAILALAEPYLAWQEEGMDIVLIADRSASIGAEGLEQEQEFLQLVGGSKLRGSHDTLSLISFGATAQVETSEQSGALALRFDRVVDPHASNLFGALALAAERALPHRQTRFVLLTDGLYTGTDPLRPEALAVLRGREVWYRRVGAPTEGDVAAAGISVPARVHAGAGFLVRFALYSQGYRNVHYELSRGGQRLSGGAARLQPGLNHFVARDLVTQAGQAEYRLRVTAEADPVPENNAGAALLAVETSPRVLVASPQGDEGVLARLLRDAAIPVDLVAAGGMDWSPARLAPYRVVILENLPLDRLGPDGIRALAETVESGVSALLVTGGENSFGQGGYHKSDIDPLLPVTMELRQEQRRGSLALAVALDRSGSMTAPAGSGGLQKMDLANLGTVEAIRMLSPADQVAVIAVDSSSHVIVPLSQADDTAELQRVVRRIESMGGGIFVRTALEAAEKEIRKSSIPTRHIILFSDAADSEEQENCIAMAGRFVADGIGLSVVALGSPADSDASFLKDLAAAGKGEIYFTHDAAQLPRLFSQEVIRVSQRGFVVEPTASKPLPDLLRLRIPPPAYGPVAAAYSLSSPRKGASCALVTADDFEAPLVAFWQKQRAVTAAVTLDLDGPHTGGLYDWKPMPGLLLNLVRHLAGAIRQSDTAAYSQTAFGTAEVRIEVEEALADRLRARPLSVRFLPPAGGAAREAPLVWTSPTEAVAHALLADPGHYLPILDLGEEGVVRAPPATLPYSPEFLPRTGLSGEKTLALLAEATRGREIVKADEIFTPMETDAEAGRMPVLFWLALLFLLLLLFEIAEKRLLAFDWIRSALRARRARTAPGEPAEAGEGAPGGE